jgi:hypothetical protein
LTIIRPDSFATWHGDSFFHAQIADDWHFGQFHVARLGAQIKKVR